MQIRLRFFASIREAVGTGAMAWPTQATLVAGLRDELLAQGGVWAEALARGKVVRVSLDQVMVDETAPLHEGCEVAFFPPVTGG
ncbi:MAG TPA: molybdopterin converting factor subunit 1 [Macromonas sp.]|nr:molybdopterin converting factor subunit 1 [Macromonas sp.]